MYLGIAESAALRTAREGQAHRGRAEWRAVDKTKRGVLPGAAACYAYRGRRPPSVRRRGGRGRSLADVASLEHRNGTIETQKQIQSANCRSPPSAWGAPSWEAS